MKKPPIQKPVQADFVQTAVRMPRALRDELRDTGKYNGRTMNAEILSRLQASPLEEIKRQNEELKKLIYEVLDYVRE